ncbi:MAG: hypothetical protein JRJ75_15230 [Deltaproteobacteria bacterium]|nr:hypothetical protein [Deltaproteobacteria bacterium]
MGHKSGRKRGKGKELRIVAVEFVPTPGVENHLARLYDLLLRERLDQSTSKGGPQDADQDSDRLATDSN